MISAAVQRLHQLAWQPGKWMHERWWQHLDLAEWRDSYQRYPVCQHAIDRLIVANKGFPQHVLPGSLNEEETLIIMLESKLHRLMTAMGLVVLACQDYLLLGRYRRILAPQLGEHGCDQLLALYPNWNTEPASLSESELIDESTQIGVQWLSMQADNHIPSQALLTLLPPVEVPSSMPVLPPALPTLIKLARFL